MKNAKLFSIAIVFALLTGCKNKVDASPMPRVPARGGVIELDNPNIHVNGAGYVSSTSAKLSFKRFSDESLNAPANIRRFDANVALSTSGISIEFKAKSTSINLAFSQETGLNEKGAFKILRDGADLQTIPFEGSLSQPIEINLKSLPVDKEYLYEIILPSYANVSLTKLELDKGSELIPYKPEQKKIYLSFGDSITHGRGQDGCSFLTYPFLLAQKLNMRLFNLGIGGARISMPIAEMSKDLPKADLITILIGFNDFEGAKRTAAQFEADYRDYLTAIRKNQPSAEIYCITLLHTTVTTNKTTGLTPNHFRDIIKKIVAAYQATDNKLHIIEGDKMITSSVYLADRVHLNIAGASKLADGLYNKIMNLDDDGITPVTFPVVFPLGKVNGVNSVTATNQPKWVSNGTWICTPQPQAYAQWVKNAPDPLAGNNFTNSGPISSPGVKGIWTGDYLEFVLPVKQFAANTKVKMKFPVYTRQGPIYWIIEYLDGAEWKSNVKSIVSYASGYTRNATFAMNYGGNVIEDSMTLTNAIESGLLRVRLRCVDGSLQASASTRVTERATPNLVNGDYSTVFYFYMAGSDVTSVSFSIE